MFSIVGIKIAFGDHILNKKNKKINSTKFSLALNISNLIFRCYEAYFFVFISFNPATHVIPTSSQTCMIQFSEAAKRIPPIHLLFRIHQ